MTHVIQFHIGPVQEFIAAARRSRDLWYGSWFLSELSKAAAKAVVDAEGEEALIFPAPVDVAELEPRSDFNVANKILALISGDPSEGAKAVKKAVEDRRDALRDAALKEVWGVIDGEAAKAQIADLTEFYWAAVPYDDDYVAAREAVDALLAARKNTRTFAPVGSWAAKQVAKSSLDGTREHVLSLGDIGDADKMYTRFRARPKEYLSGVDLLKRLGEAGENSHFPSTSHMAAMPLKAQLKRAASPNADRKPWDDYLETLPDEVKKQEIVYHDLKLPLLDQLDGALLFESRLRDYLDGDKWTKAAAALAEFFKRDSQKPEDSIARPPIYYAILNGDGDFMGKAISHLTDPEKNRAFSRTLAGFAGEAREIIRKHDGAAVFTGGDDVLAFLPLHTAVQCAAALAGEFAARMAPYRYAGKDGKEGSPTFSAGLAIVHHIEPLEDALELARGAERAAKRIGDGRKNALTVVLAKRGGAPRQVTGHWNELVERLLFLAGLHQAEVIPGRLAYQLQDIYLTLGGSAMDGVTELREIFRLEAERLIGRKRTADGQGKLKKAHADYIRGFFDDHTTLAAIPLELVIAGEIAKVATLAEMMLPLPPDKTEAGATGNTMPQPAAATTQEDA